MRRFKVGDVVMIGERVAPGIPLGYHRWPIGELGLVDVDDLNNLPHRYGLELGGGDGWAFFAPDELHYIGRL